MIRRRIYSGYSFNEARDLPKLEDAIQTTIGWMDDDWKGGSAEEEIAETLREWNDDGSVGYLAHISPRKIRQLCETYFPELLKKLDKIIDRLDSDEGEEIDLDDLVYKYGEIVKDSDKLKKEVIPVFEKFMQRYVQNHPDFELIKDEYMSNEYQLEGPFPDTDSISIKLRSNGDIECWDWKKFIKFNISNLQEFKNWIDSHL